MTFDLLTSKSSKRQNDRQMDVYMDRQTDTTQINANPKSTKKTS